MSEWLAVNTGPVWVRCRRIWGVGIHIMASNDAACSHTYSPAPSTCAGAVLQAEPNVDPSQQLLPPLASAAAALPLSPLVCSATPSLCSRVLQRRQRAVPSAGRDTVHLPGEALRFPLLISHENWCCTKCWTRRCAPPRWWGGWVGLLMGCRPVCHPHVPCAFVQPSAQRPMPTPRTVILPCTGIHPVPSTALHPHIASHPAALPGDKRRAAATCPTPHAQLPLRFSHPAALPGDECGTAVRVSVGGWRQGKAPSGLFDWRLLLFYLLGPLHGHLCVGGWREGKLCE